MGNFGFLDFVLKLMLCLSNSGLVGALSEVPKVCLAWGLGNAAESSES